MAITTLENCKAYLNIAVTDTSSDNILNMLIGSIQQLIESYCKRKFELQAYTGEQHTINHKIYTDNYPIVSVEGLKRSSDDVLDIVLTEDDMTGAYRIHADYIEMIDMKYVTMGNKTMYAEKEQSYVELDYTAGFSQDEMPSDLMLAATKLVALEYLISSEGRIGVEILKEGAIQETYYKSSSQSMPMDVKAILDRYAKVRVG